jgi:hypothetical protein
MRLHVALALILAAGCSDTIPPQPSPIAGTYQTAVSLQSSTCTGITVQNNPTTIVHSEGAPSFTLEHAGQTYSGALDIANSTFTTAAKAITVGTATHTLTIVGVFTNAGFTADVTAVVSGSASCQYVVHWQGTR